MRRKKKNKASMMKRGLVLAVLVFVLGLIGVWGAGSFATSPNPSNVGAAPESLKADNVTIVDRNGARVSGWLVAQETDKGAVLLLHGIRADRRSLVSRAMFLSRAGYSVLMIDLAAHGESDGEAITFGFQEANSVTAALEFLKQKWPDKKIGVIGLSLGGAAALISSGNNRVAIGDAYVFEAVFPRLANAIENRLAIKVGVGSKILSKLLLWQVPVRLGYNPDRVSPVVLIKNLARPVLIIAGELDQRTTGKDTDALLKSAKQPKNLWTVPGAGHQDFHRFAKQDYENKILFFLKNNL